MYRQLIQGILIGFLTIGLFSCATTYSEINCSYLIKPSTGRKETSDTRIATRTFIPTKKGRIYFSFSKQDDGYSINVNTYISPFVDDVERFKPENKLTITLDDNTTIELEPREERLANDVPEAVYLISQDNLLKIANATRASISLQYTTFNKKTQTLKIDVNPNYLYQLKERAKCILGFK